MSNEYVDRNTARKSYRPASGMSEGLKRAREPYRIKNALVGLGLGAFAVGVWAYSISAVKQDVFDDVDEEARALGAGSPSDSTGTTTATTTSTLPTAAASTTVAATPALPGAAGLAQGTANIVLPGTLPLPPVSSPNTPTTTRPKGVLARVLEQRWPKALDPESKTLVWGAPSVDNLGRMGSRSS
ncbi:hypothetical protein D9611_002774 [Ephemerocybe angulata]|uniref:Cytochrome c oxidase assembly factor 3 n=1 Tax=Ephemerocybe angulata TaxID=980116 RepID=A0A8H5C1J4_9AGAR|nr:hypothetical protein D9611_002774 [Tulosesus angulatus]